MATTGSAPGCASLIGGIVVGLAVCALWALLARDILPGVPLAIVPGVLLGLAVAVWIRAADL